MAAQALALASPQLSATSLPTSPAFSTKCINVIPSNYSFSPPNDIEDPICSSSNSQADSAISEAAMLLAAGEVVAIPTETVYGLAANALCQSAVTKIFSAKQRPLDNPLIVHVSSLRMLREIAPSGWRIPPSSLAAMQAFWPGPLTILLDAEKTKVAPAVTCGLSTVAVRFPAHPVARALISKCGFPLAAPSANASGRPSPTLASHVEADLGGRIPCILDGGACEVGVESTVLDPLRVPPAILRPGGASFEDLRQVAGFEELQVFQRDFADAALECNPTTPGMKYRHYSPTAGVVLFDVRQTAGSALANGLATAGTTLEPSEDSKAGKELDELMAMELQPNERVGVILTETTEVPETQACALANQTELVLLTLGPNVADVARELFKALRDMDDRSVSRILVEGVRGEGEGLAVMNRLRKAASKIVYH